MPNQSKRTGKGRTKSVNPMFKVDTLTAEQQSASSNESPHVSTTMRKFRILSQVTGQLADTPTRGLPTRGLDICHSPTQVSSTSIYGRRC